MRTSVIIASIFLVFWSTAESGTQATPVVKEICVRNLGAGRIDKSFVLVHTGVKIGSELDRLRISKDVKALLATGRFSYIAVEIEPLDHGVRLVYSIRNKLKLAEPVEIAGAHEFREEKIRDLLGLEVGDLVDDQVLDNRRQRVIEEYRREYYPNVTLTWRTDETDHAEGMAKVSVVIREGKRAHVAKVNFVGNKEISSDVLRKAMKQPARWNPFLWLRKRRYDPEELETARAEIRNIYLNAGFLDATVDFPTVETQEDGSLAVNVNVREGVAYRFGEISLGGITLFPEAELKRLVGIKSGDIASVDAIRRTVQALEDYYGTRGYANAVVKPELDSDAASGIVNIHFAVTEGNLMRIRNVLIRGNTHTKEKVIRRELLVFPGEIFDKVKVRRSERIISNLGYFSNVRSYSVNTPALDEKDLIFEVEEKATGQFMVGAGFSSIDKLMSFVELSQGNFDINGWPYFKGGGQKLKVRGEIGSTRKLYELSFVEPWFLDRKLSLGIDLYRSEVDYSDYDIERTGGAVSLGKSLPGANRIDFQYRLEKSVLSDIVDTNQYFYADSSEEEYYFREEDRLSSSLKTTLTHDTRDNPFIPTRGNRVKLFTSISGGPLGFDTDIYELGISATRYMPLWYKHVLSVCARCETVEEYGDTTEVPIGDRLFIGGGRTLRGFEYRDVGPKVIRTVETEEGGEEIYHRPVGGKSLAMASAEYTIPIVSGIRIATFFDIGNVWGDAYDFQLDRLASSAGVGIRLDIPGFPIKVDRAWVIEKDDEFTDMDAWVFWIGYDY